MRLRATKQQGTEAGQHDHTMRSMLSLVSMVICLVLAVSSAEAADPVIVRLGHRFPENDKWHLAFSQAAEVFNARETGIELQVEPGWSVDKYKVAVAAGNAPEVYLVDSPQAPAWGVSGFLAPLNDLAEAAGVTRDSFIPAAWDQNLWQGTLHAIPIQVDPNFGLIWNKELFGIVGLDPEAPPRTVEEFDLMFLRLTRSTADGTPVSVGMIPWTLTRGHANTIYTWGWLFGGEFYDYEQSKATAHDPRVIDALEYLTQYWERYEPVRAALSANIPPGYNRFTSGREAMMLSTPSNAFLIMRDFPEMDVGVTRMFNNPVAGVENAQWIGGYVLGLSAGAENPDAAFDVIKFLTADPEGVETFASSGSWVPANFTVPYFRSLGTDPLWQPYADIVLTTTRYRPAIPAMDVYNAELVRVFPSILRRNVSFIGTMEEISKIVDAKVAEMTAAK
ncbi:MAG: extracellular solute-binding protein [Firmicutes bacterium]|nr:extracellular solute-binding protein [Bacillota bacterium]